MTSGSDSDTQRPAQPHFRAGNLFVAATWETFLAQHGPFTGAFGVLVPNGVKWLLKRERGEKAAASVTVYTDAPAEVRRRVEDDLRRLAGLTPPAGRPRR